MNQTKDERKESIDHLVRVYSRYKTLSIYEIERDIPSYRDYKD